LSKRIEQDERDIAQYPEIVKTLKHSPFSLKNDKLIANVFEEDNEEEINNNYEQITKQPPIPKKFLASSNLRDSNKHEQNKLILNDKNEIHKRPEKNEIQVNKDVTSLLCLNYMTNDKASFFINLLHNKVKISLLILEKRGFI